MRVFKVPFDIKREEKIFGGYLSLRQVTYLMLATSSLSILATNIITSIKVLFIILVSTLFLLCSFFKINEQNFDKLFFYALKYIFRKRKFIYGRCQLW